MFLMYDLVMYRQAVPLTMDGLLRTAVAASAAVSEMVPEDKRINSLDAVRCGCRSRKSELRRGSP
jgi:hypothetical protein